MAENKGVEGEDSEPLPSSEEQSKYAAAFREHVGKLLAHYEREHSRFLLEAQQARTSV